MKKLIITKEIVESAERRTKINFTAAEIESVQKRLDFYITPGLKFLSTIKLHKKTPAYFPKFKMISNFRSGEVLTYPKSFFEKNKRFLSNEKFFYLGLKKS